MSKSRIVLFAIVLLGALVLTGCVYVPGPGGVHGSVGYAVAPSGTCFIPEVDVEARGHYVVPPPMHGGYPGYQGPQWRAKGE